MSPTTTIPNNQVPEVRRELSRMEHRRRWPLGRRNGGDAAAIRAARIRLGAAMIESMEAGRPTVTLDLGEAAVYVEEALERIRATAHAQVH
jgi:hypothetical protein